jgi:hypothetical protein
MHLVGHGHVPHQAELQHGLPPGLDHHLVVGRQHGPADHSVQVAVGQQGPLVVHELRRDSELLNVGQNLGNTKLIHKTTQGTLIHYAPCTVYYAVHNVQHLFAFIPFKGLPVVILLDHVDALQGSL